MSRTYYNKKLKMDAKTFWNAIGNDSLPRWVQWHHRGRGHERSLDEWDLDDMLHTRVQNRRMKEIIREERIWLTGECQWIWFWDNDTKAECEALDEIERLEFESDMNMVWLRNVRETFYGVF